MQHKLVPVLEALRTSITSERFVVAAVVSGCEMKAGSGFGRELGGTFPAFVVRFFGMFLLFVSVVFFLGLADFGAEAAFKAGFLLHRNSSGRVSSQIMMTVLISFENLAELGFSLAVIGYRYIWNRYPLVQLKFEC